MLSLSYDKQYRAWHEAQQEKERVAVANSTQRTQFQCFLGRGKTVRVEKDGFQRMQTCRDALNAIDSKGWNRSFHQRLFHDQFMRACARIFFKMDAPGAFARAHQAILEMNSWETLSQEVLISTPRRFGKTISVSMFAAAMIFSCPNCEISIYSTCKRISQKLLRNVQKFLLIIYDALNISKMKEIRSNMEEMEFQGPEGTWDVRKVNSYPSKVSLLLSVLVNRAIFHQLKLKLI